MAFKKHTGQLVIVAFICVFLMITVNQLKSIKLQVLQEGVETKEQLDIITSFGGNLIQGYYFSKPLSDIDFIAYCKRFAG